MSGRRDYVSIHVRCKVHVPTTESRSRRWRPRIVKIICTCMYACAHRDDESALRIAQGDQENAARHTAIRVSHAGHHTHIRVRIGKFSFGNSTHTCIRIYVER